MVKPKRNAKSVDNTKTSQVALHKLPGKSRKRFDREKEVGEVF